MSERPPVDTEWLNNRWRLFLIGTLSASIGLAPVLLVHRFLPMAPLWWFPPLLFLAAFEGAWTTHWLGYPSHRRKRIFAFRLGEFLLFVILLRLLTWATVSGWPTRETVYAWLLSPALFFDFPFSGGLILLLLAWSEAVSLAGMFGRMALQPDELLLATRGRWEERPPAYADRSALASAVADHWLAGAFVLALLAGLARFTLRVGETVHVGLRTVALPREFVMLLLVYFLGGLFLVGEARRGALRAQWHYEGTRWQENLQTHWRRIAVTILLLAAFVAGLIPFGSTDPLTPLIEDVFLFFVQVGYVLAGLLLFLLMLLLSLLPFSQGEPAPAARPEKMVPRAGETARALLPPWLGGAIIWAIVLVLVGIALHVYWRERGLSLTWATLRRWWRTFLSWWKRQPRRAREMAHQVVARTRRRVSLPSIPPLPGITMPLSLIPWRRLSPAQQVRYFYLTAIRQAQRAGIERRDNETPEEYARTLATHRPGLSEEVQLLTAAFERARYAGEAFADEEVQELRRTWQRFRAEIRRPQRRKAL